MIPEIFALTQYDGAIVGPIAKLLGYVISGIYSFFSMFGIENAALCIFLFTFIMRAFMVPIYYRQQKASKLTSKMNPELQAITAKYRGKRDRESQMKMQQETQAVYDKYGSNPLSGCLPILITFPIMIALYRVIQIMPAYMPSLKEIYENVANAIMPYSSYVEILKEVGDSASINSIIEKNSPLGINHVIDILTNFNQEKWDLLATKIPEASAVINSMSAEIGHIYNVFGLFSIADVPHFTRPLTLVIPALAGILQWINGKQMLNSSSVPEGNAQMANVNKSMMNIMPLIQVVFCYTFPIGVGIYWIAVSVFSIIQYYFFGKMLDKVDVDELIRQNREKAAKKRVKRGETEENVNLNKFATTSTKSINVAEKKEVPSHKKEEGSTTDSSKGTTKKVKNNYKITDYKRREGEFKAENISEIANMLKRD